MDPRRPSIRRTERQSCAYREQEVDYETGENLAKEFGIKFFETSAKDHVNVTEAFDALTRDVIQRKFKGGGENKTTVDIDLKESKSSSCCK
eukprot:1362225-Amorphochlora_amoeboformis.AAC.4